MFMSGCVNTTDYFCKNYTACPKGQYLDNKAEDHDGVCRPCTNCSAYGLDTKKNCSAYQDSLCGGSACGPRQPCNSTSYGNFFCDYSGDSPACGFCPVSLAFSGRALAML